MKKRWRNERRLRQTGRVNAGKLNFRMQKGIDTK